MQWDITSENYENADAHVKEQVRLFRFNNNPHGPFTSDGSPIDFEALNIYLHDESDKLAGALLGSTMFGALSISWLWVDEKWRGQGYARAMIDKAIEVAKERGCTCAWGNTWEAQGVSHIYDHMGAELVWRQAYPGQTLLWYRYDFD